MIAGSPGKISSVREEDSASWRDLDPAMKCTRVASEDMIVASCLKSRVVSLGAKDSKSFVSSDMLSV